MKSLRTRAIFKSVGYVHKIDLLNDVVYENGSGDMVYLNLEKDLYNYNVKYKGRKYASKNLLDKLFLQIS